MFIWCKDRDDDDGLDQFVRKCLETDNLAWLPIGQALRNEGTAAAEDPMEKVEVHVDKLETTVRDLNEASVRVSKKHSEMIQRDVRRISERLESFVTSINRGVTPAIAEAPAPAAPETPSTNAEMEERLGKLEQQSLATLEHLNRIFSVLEARSGAGAATTAADGGEGAPTAW
uniref:Uncharacterized protein n=2 Tax=Phaeomonas parva TaxID=124430 RepID=A0A7S1UB34_9STRA|mmetsp:Transcript_39864/g.124633  ORF Transcript_39864/g.124633 Transcript_39864/m.124633 type:complete len:173 (+) Transcript_39864:51-569(+)